MLTDILTRVFILILVSPVIFIAYKRSNISNSRWLFLLAGLFILDIIWFNLPFNFFKNAVFAWQATIVATLWDLFFIYFLSRIQPKEFGLTAKFNTGTVKPFIHLTIVWSVVLFLVFYYFFDHRQLAFERFLYELMMPGISEELIYRGILLTLLNRVFTARLELLKAKLGWGLVIVTLLYGLVNAIRLKDIHDLTITFDSTIFFFTTCSALLFGYIKERTGNLWAAIVSHNLWNTIVGIAQAIN